MNIVNQTTEVVKQGGVRRGANMGILAITHPDILRFIHAKNDQTSLTNFNISVTVTDLFMDAVDSGIWFQTEFKDEPWTAAGIRSGHGRRLCRLSHGRTVRPRHLRTSWHSKQPTFAIASIEEPPMAGMVFAPDIWNRIIASAHKYAEPGIIFIDEVNRHNHMMASMGPIYACNPCGEQQLHFNNSCNLGSIDVAKFFRRTGDGRSGRMHRLGASVADVTHLCTQFLDNVVDAGHFPLPEIDDVVKRTRPVGLGIMGFADLCLRLGVTYGSDESLDLMETRDGLCPPRSHGWRR